MPPARQAAGNVGEWSELYALGHLLAEGGAFAADKDQKKIASIFYKVLQIYSNENPDLIYDIKPKSVFVLDNGVAVVRIPRGVIATEVQALLKDLRRHQAGRAFALKSGDRLLTVLSKNSIKTPSSVSADLEAILEDFQTKAPTPKLSFSIKSQMGSPSTLFNASHSTNLIYEVKRPAGNRKPLPTFARQSAVKTNLRALMKAGFTLSFHSYENSQFETNLKYIDSNLPDYLANVMLNYYLSSSTGLSKIAEQTYPVGHPHRDQKLNKIKEFLHQVATGLRPNQPWTTTSSVFGGLILVKTNGDVFIYYLYNLKDFREYLYENIRFETGSATKHGFGLLYADQGKHFIKLNLQLRFKR